jgi:hydroxymethylbilane synthase
LKLRISSRQSELAQFQAYQVGEALQKAEPSLEIEYLFRESLGDKNLQDPLWKMPEKGVFTEDFYADLIEEKTEDQRDLLLYKKSSHGKKNIRLFSSSPRRAHNLKDFLSWALPWKSDEVQFESVRGNIATRVRKWRENSEVDGLIVAKAAFDRLLDGKRFSETCSFLQETLKEADWMVLPLTFNPNAAAQGALAIEVKNGRDDVAALLKKINCEKTFLDAQKERDILKTFGGGCHLALGMSCLTRAYGDITIVKGLTPDGKSIDQKTMVAKKSVPVDLPKVRLEFTHERTRLPLPDVHDLDALYVSKAEAWPTDLKFSGLIWTAGCETWKKLASLGVWVSGSNESLGEGEDFRVDNFFATSLRWGRLSHADASPKGSKKPLATYKINTHLVSQNIKADCAFIWTSPQEFDLAVTRFPQIKFEKHICGSGRTYDALVQRLGTTENLYIEIF